MARDKSPITKSTKERAERKRAGKGRAQKTLETRRKLFDATIKMVGRLGYQDASIAKITARARVAQGTFYNYFDNQQDLFDELLPNLGGDLLTRIRERLGALPSDATAIEREEVGLRTFFDYLSDVPEFYRILNEAETFAPKGHRRHVDNMIGRYRRALERARDEGAISIYDGREFEAVATMLVAIRHYLAMRYTYSNGDFTHLPEWVAKTYMKFLCHGLFAPEPAADAEASPATVRKGSIAIPRGASIGSELHGRTISSENDIAVLALDAGRRHLAEDGAVLRAVLCALIEQAGALAIDSERTANFNLVEMSLTSVRPAQEGTLIATARRVSETSNLQLVRVDVTSETRTGQLLATAQLIFDRRYRS